MQRYLFSLLLTAGLAWLGAGCGSNDITPGTKQVGQRCFASSDCVTGLMCGADRICLPTAPSGTNNTLTLGEGTSLTGGTSGGTLTAVSPPPGGCVEGEAVCEGPDTGLICEGGTFSALFKCSSQGRCVGGECVFGDPDSRCPPREKCIDDFIVTTCTQTPEGDIILGQERCPAGLECAQGRCQRDPIRDRDGDGFDVRSDCDDLDPDINPGERERCGNGVDDNCDGLIDGQDEQCQANQRCAKQGDRCRGMLDSTGFYDCLDTNNDGNHYCYGVCNPSRSGGSGSNTCPDRPGEHRCVSLDQDPMAGICLAKCEQSTSVCNSPFSCVAFGPSGFDQEIVAPSFGGCIDSGFSELGQVCGAADTFCGQGGICERGMCFESCQPYQIGPMYRCSEASSACNPTSGITGVCQPLSECSPRDIGNVCEGGGGVCLRGSQRVECVQTCNLAPEDEPLSVGCFESGGSCVPDSRLSTRPGVGVCR